MNDRPTHLVAHPGADRTICGLHYRRDGQRAYPQMWAAYVERRRRSYAEHGLTLVLCDECEAGAEGVTS